MADEEGRGARELWELVWMVIEEATRKLPPEQRDPVMRTVQQQDESQVECLGRGDPDIMFRICDVVFQVPLVTKTVPAEPAQDLPIPDFFPDKKEGP